MSVARVSVVMAVRNGADFLEAGLRSVLTQDFRDFEFVIIDDASTDATPAIIAQAGDPRIVYHRNETNIGQTASLNLGLRLARGAYIARMDADDAYLPGKLRAQVAFLDRHPGVAVCGTWAQCVDNHGVVTGVFEPPTAWDEIKARLLWTSPICHVSVLMRRDVILGVGGYDESYRYSADYHLWSEIVRRGHRLANLPERLMSYRVSEASFSGASLLGAAGDESVRIILENARTLAQVEFSDAEARAIHLRAHPQWGGVAERLTAHRALRRLAAAAGARRGLGPSLARWSALAWSVARAPRPAAGESLPVCTLTERAALVAGSMLRRLRPSRLVGVRAAVARVLR